MGTRGSLAYPVIPGHEFSAHVVALGAGVTHPALGTFVVVDPMVFCGHCVQCRSGWTNLCVNGGGLGTTADGAFARYVKVQANQCEPVPESVPAERGPRLPSRSRASCTPSTALDRWWAPTPSSSAPGPPASCSPGCSLWAERGRRGRAPA